MRTRWLKNREVLLAFAIIVLALLSVWYGVMQTNAQKSIVSCNRSIIIQTNDALRQRDAATVAQATSAKAADEARRQVILVLVNRMLRGEAAIDQTELDQLLIAYNKAVDQRATDLDAVINRAKSASIPVYTCLGPDAIGN